MHILDIHHEGINKENFPNLDPSYYFKIILDRNIPVIISPSLHNYNQGQWNSKKGQEALELIKEIVKRDNSVLGQQGYSHKCKYNHVFADPWHEFYCLWNKSIDIDEQEELIKRGKGELEKLIGVTPNLFAPPNHHFDESTLEVAHELAYKFFTDQAVIPLRTYQFGNMLVIPEGNLRRNEYIGRDAVYIHTDQINESERLFYDIIKRTNPVKELKASKISLKKINLNQRKKYRRKAFRDITKFSKRLLKRVKKSLF